MEKEVWKTIEDFTNYEVSTFGNIRNKSKHIMKFQKNYSGYLNISLRNATQNTSSTFSVHRLVAKAFIHNTGNKLTVNHIDRNKSNNHIDNLEWATMSEQNYHSAIVSTKDRPLLCKSVLRLDLHTNDIIEEYKSISDAAKWVINNDLTTIKIINPNNISIISSKICAVANNKRIRAYNFKWKYISKEIDFKDENWKEIPFEIVEKYNYFVSNLGRFKNNKNDIIANYTPSTGYIRIRIKNRKFLLHRLVALTFLENPKNKEFVNHKDGNKTNNLLENLEWATCLENNMHKINSGLSNCTKKVIQYDTNMNKIQEFNSTVECSHALIISKVIIRNNCRGKTKSSKCGYIFRYSE